MIERLLSSPNYDATKRLLDVSILRHEALAANIGNLETPGYKRLDLPKDFQTAMNEALRSGSVKSLTLPGLEADVQTPAQRKDGNNVVLQDELMAMNKNAAEYEALTDFVSGSIKTLRMAISGHTS